MPIRVNLWRTFLGLAMFLSLLATASGSIVGASTGDEIAWQIEIKTAFTADQMKQPGWEENARALQAALATRLQNNGTRLETTRAAKANGAEFSFRASGKGTLAQFRRVAFDDLSPVGGLIGGPAALTLNGAVRRGENAALVLESNLSTGYAWQIDNASALRSNGQTQFRQKANLPGASAIQTLALTAMQDGNASLTLVYRRPWEAEEPTRAVTLTAARLASLAEIVNPIAPTAAQIAAPNLPVRAPENVAALPSTFNWASSDNYRGANKLTPIRNQGSCGTCWAFSTVAAFEGNIYIKDNVSRDLSEQYLVSCNTDGYSPNCDLGGWWAHDYHQWKTVPNDSIAGAVYESSFPYTSGSTRTIPVCGAPYSHPYKLNNWYYVGSQWTIPSVDAIKNAIYNYGPVSVTLCAGPVFSNYSGGIYSTNESASCNGGINHAVNLVGWNDAENTWVLRNSWGSWWGESGYMRIARGVSNIGYNASYVVYNGSVTPQFKKFLPLVTTSQGTNGWVTIMNDDFEGSFPGVWSLAYNTNKNAGYLWGKRSCRTYAGNYSAWGVGGGTLGAGLSCGSYYPDYVQTWMRYGPFNLANTSAAELRARLWTHTESPTYAWDTVALMVSINNNNYYGTQYYGDWNWNEQVVNLANVYTLGNVLGQSNVWIAAIFDTDSSVVYTEGGYVDNVLLRKCPTGASCPPGAASPMAGANQFARPAQMTLPR